jgi:hypothetical protein
VTRVALVLLVCALGGCDTAGFRDAYMSLDAEGKRERERFFTDTEAIYCIGKMASGVDDVTVTASVRAQQLYDPRDGSAIEVDFQVGAKDIAPGAGEDITVGFLLERENDDAPYDAGKFVCELAIDGEVRERLPFEVAFPDCPEAPIITGTACAGFVLDGTRCPNPFGQPCLCSGERGWQCP